ncbi:hypothetical protein BDY17DRAFT_290342 [Neohortaea acidophila]|uniref:Secreted protein n=1 Tax=Neohortaea acidophila TaxID=245834 RepID=A0A6A6Q7W5_9PEZI|nr:uncharacterized protein BDY17DRAFT_290342 [Neohortaea acidophila]KAF2488161.1 hypothetical protein BDY17DRAFT_290342 [Neohortaea acidophila]
MFVSVGFVCVVLILMDGKRGKEDGRREERDGFDMWEVESDADAQSAGLISVEGGTTCWAAMVTRLEESIAAIWQVAEKITASTWKWRNHCVRRCSFARAGTMCFVVRIAVLSLHDSRQGREVVHSKSDGAESPCINQLAAPCLDMHVRTLEISSRAGVEPRSIGCGARSGGSNVD